MIGGGGMEPLTTFFVAGKLGVWGRGLGCTVEALRMLEGIFAPGGMRGNVCLTETVASAPVSSEATEISGNLRKS
jgi:hypothetical protein